MCNSRQISPRSEIKKLTQNCRKEKNVELPKYGHFINRKQVSIFSVSAKSVSHSGMYLEISTFNSQETRGYTQLYSSVDKATSVRYFTNMYKV